LGSYDLDALGLGPDYIPATKAVVGTYAKRKLARDRLFVPSTAWPEFAAVVAADLSGRAAGLWLAIRMQAKLEGNEWVRVRTHLHASLGFTNRAARSRSWSGPASSRSNGARATRRWCAWRRGGRLEESLKRGARRRMGGIRRSRAVKQRAPGGQVKFPAKISGQAMA
jgi:hypothetical protein